MLVCWVSAFLGSLLLLDILGFTDLFAIPEYIYFFLSNSYRVLRFCRFIRVLGIRMLVNYGN